MHSFTRRCLLMCVTNLVVMKDLSTILFEILPLKLQLPSLPYSAIYGSQITVRPLLCFLFTPALLLLFEQIPAGFWTSEQAFMFSECNILQEVTGSVCALHYSTPSAVWMSPSVKPKLHLRCVLLIGSVVCNHLGCSALRFSVFLYWSSVIKGNRVTLQLYPNASSAQRHFWHQRAP